MHDLPSLDMLYVLLILLPGFVTLIIERAMFFRPDEGSFDKVAKALFYSLCNYALFSLTTLNLLSGSETNCKPDTAGIIVIFIISTLLGVIIGAVKTNDLHMSILRWLRLTRRTCRSSIWLDLFVDLYPIGVPPTSAHPNVLVFLRGGRKLHGLPRYYSDHFHDGPVLFLRDAQWILDDEEESTIDIPNPGVLLNGAEIKYLQLFTPGEQVSQNAGEDNH